MMSETALANISIFPYSVDFSDRTRKRVQSIRVINSSDKMQTYRVSVINFNQDEEGKLHEVEINDRSAKEYVSFSPRQFTLKPNDVQTINIARKSLSSAKDGEYVSHLKISEVNIGAPKVEKNNDSNSNTLSMELKALFAVTIPVTIEKPFELAYSNCYITIPALAEVVESYNSGNYRSEIEDKNTIEYIINNATRKRSFRDSNT